METDKILEKRMYFLVPYNISPIQQAIQAGHAALEYAYEHGDDPEYIDFIKNWKTWIILNGGTTNNSLDENLRGTLNDDLVKIVDNNIKYASFYEPDLNDALTAVCLIVDERVFNREKYPDFNYWIQEYYGESEYRSWGFEIQLDEYIKATGITYEIYILKELLNNKKLA